MKFVYPDINEVFETENDYVNTVIIENQDFLYRFLQDISDQILGFNGRTVVSKKQTILPFNKNVELLKDFVPFDVNQKGLVTKASSAAEKLAVSSIHYQECIELMNSIERFLLDISFDMVGDIQFTKINPSSIIKACGLEFRSEYSSIAEKLIDYFELVTEYDKEKLFVTVNLRSYVNDEDISDFIDTVLRQGYHVIMIESSERPLVSKESRFIIDNDLCEIKC